jgi:hypothetical protein
LSFVRARLLGLGFSLLIRSSNTDVMGMDFYQTMKKAPAVVEKWKPYVLTAQQVWQNANTREEAIQFLLNLPDPKPEEFEKVVAFLKALPYVLRGLLQEAAKGLPPSPGGRPHGLTPDQSREVCRQIGQLYGEGVDLAEAKLRMARRYGVSLSTIQRAWKKRALQMQFQAAESQVPATKPSGR